MHPKELVFLNGHGKDLNPRGMNYIFKEVLQKAGLPPHRFTLHHLRHTFASLFLQHRKTETINNQLIAMVVGIIPFRASTWRGFFMAKKGQAF